MTKKIARGKGTMLFCRNSPRFWSPRQPRFGLQMQPTTVRECRWIRPSWKWLLVRERWSEMQLDRVFHYFSHLGNDTLFSFLLLLQMTLWQMCLNIKSPECLCIFLGRFLEKELWGQVEWALRVLVTVQKSCTNLHSCHSMSFGWFV